MKSSCFGSTTSAFRGGRWRRRWGGPRYIFREGARRSRHGKPRSTTLALNSLETAPARIRNAAQRPPTQRRVFSRLKLGAASREHWIDAPQSKAFLSQRKSAALAGRPACSRKQPKRGSAPLAGPLHNCLIPHETVKHRCPSENNEDPCHQSCVPKQRVEHYFPEKLHRRTD